MALGFLMKDSIYILYLTGERDTMGSDRAVFTRGNRVQCGWARVSSRTEDNSFGQETRGLSLAIIPPIEEELRWVEHAGKVYVVKETRRFSGFFVDHLELLLEEYKGRCEIT